MIFEQSPRDTSVRRAAVGRLMFLVQHNSLTTDHIKTVAEAFGVHPRSVRRWMDNAAQHNGRYTPGRRASFTLTQEMRDAVALFCGNIAAAYRDLRKRGSLGDDPVCYATFHRAVTTAYTPGFLAGLRGGERERRKFDVHLTRGVGHRNQAWEGDHVEASVWVNVNGHRRKPWITWFIDCASDAVCGLSVSAQTPSRENILLAVRSAVLRGGNHGPFGGSPGLVRIDRGKDFLSDTVDAAFGVLGVRVVDLPPRHPELKGTVEALNNAVKTMHFPGLPGYVHAPRTSRRTKPDPDERLLTYEAFIRHLLAWVHEWNHEHRIRTRDNRTPHELWNNDLTPIYDPDPADLHFTLETHPTPLTINSDGVHWGKKRRYLAPYMQGLGGTKVVLRYMPRQERSVELYDAKDGTYLGPAVLQNEATPQERREVRRAADREAGRLRTALDKANRQREERFEADTVPTTPRPTSDITQEQATEILNGHRQDAHARETRPDLIPLPNPTATWNNTANPAETQLGSTAPLLPPLPNPTDSWHATPLSSTPEEPTDEPHD
ncbi:MULTISPECIES: Mu transposase C-terminal domain-containing protein [Streptomyces]|uniref:Recombinase n=1 Tax=Streptomyces cadmiisoli TaxID=2184053 RepID=A0A2Z4JEX8_9ACTN|nr:MULTISPECIES: Mu transposase C-terminal domain-containing protein [Streptomyces]AWW43566.1 recombinase [Streptomyces cadmiisoli]